MKKFISICLIIVLSMAMMIPALAATNTYKTGTYTVSHSQGVNVRSTASTSGKVVGAAAKGVSFAVSKVSGSWGYTSSIKTTSGTKSGWVSLDYCALKSTTKSSSSVSISFSSISTPSVTVGSGCHIKGTIKSTGSKLSTIKAAVTNASGTTVISKSVSPNSYSYTLYDSDLDWGMTFASLKKGSYTLKYTAITASGLTKSYSVSFTVKAAKTTSSSASTATTTPTFSTSNMKRCPVSKYSNYYVVKGFQSKYCYNQFNYTYKFGRVGCTATSEAVIVSCKHGAISPDKMGWSSAGCTWDYSKSISVKDLSAQAKLNKLGSLLCSGEAVSLYSNENHCVAAVGLKSSTNLKSVKASDILIADPANGALCPLTQAASGGYYWTPYCIYIAK